MILGVDHIALSTNALSDSIGVLENCGYQTKFVQWDVPNSPCKKDFLRTYQPLHSVAYCQVQGGISIELTEHSTTSHSSTMDSPYQVLFSCPPAPLSDVSRDAATTNWQHVLKDSLGVPDVTAGLWSPFDTRLWYLTSGCSLPPFVRSLLLPVHDVPAATDFWCNALGCRRLAQGISPDGSSWQHIDFKSPVKSWCLDLVLVESRKGKKVTYIDDAGFSCLALISKRLSEDISVLKQNGIQQITDTFQLEMNNRQLNIVIFRSDEGELVELIEFQ